MRQSNFLNELLEKLCAALPQNAAILQQDVKKNFQAILKTALTSLDLVSNEEFIAQSKVLARSRERIEALETKVQALEKLLEKP